jgi:GNAT superfamily N-acetyltransferase
MRVVEEDDLVLVDSGLPCDTFNFVCRARLAEGNARERIRAAIRYFVDVGRPFSWWLNPGDEPAELGNMLLEAGLQRAETEMAMAAALDKLPLGELSPNGLHIKRVRTTAQLYDFATVVAANWTPPDPEVLRFYEQAALALLDNDPALWLYVGYLDDMAVATAELTVGGGVVGLYSVCTLESYRRRGFGSALTLRPLLDARTHGFHTAILQSAADSLYARIGFEPFGEITEYKP